MKKFPFAILVVLVFALSGCMTAEEQLQADRGRCASFGFRPDSSGFANCMMNLSNQRQLNETIQGIANAQWQAEQSRIYSQREDDEERIKELAMERSGDERFPVCTATSDDSHLMVGSGWYGRNCRMK